MTDDPSLQSLIDRIGATHVQKRLEIETHRDHQLFGQGRLFFNLENWLTAPPIVRMALKLTGLYSRARREADRVSVRENTVVSDRLPASFDGFTILHISDLHVDISEEALRHLVSFVGDLSYDICVLTGDYRGNTYGPYQRAVDGVGELRAKLRDPVYGILGNHDSIRMTPALEAMGIRMLFNEVETITRGGDSIYLAGVDDPHFYLADDIPMVASQIPRDAFSILLSHTPETYAEAAEHGFDFMLSGHTHGGQLCLPGGYAIKLEAVLPRHMGKGAWQHEKLAGYTSVGVGTSLLPVRLNCPPEVTLHRLTRA
ncbi:metallophosphoesterase [Tardiphaga alba]|uniref:Metallophosphoesterase n=1 Tax=Tardiphaga alba TaxID=340268 RepID=A0ABX8ABA6_9BRAD|nr:metallophosphoesterase [Tardiphaga alba]QUS39080.1 metallophosphoesterase [Tardiphaga alba]